VAQSSAAGPSGHTRSFPGRLKVYLGAAPGVGKTYRMLDEGRRLWVST
jgi:two-component system sensor histidine kinase KdpD